MQWMQINELCLMKEKRLLHENTWTAFIKGLNYPVKWKNSRISHNKTGR